MKNIRLITPVLLAIMVFAYVGCEKEPQSELSPQPSNNEACYVADYPFVLTFLNGNEVGMNQDANEFYAEYAVSGNQLTLNITSVTDVHRDPWVDRLLSYLVSGDLNYSLSNDTLHINPATDNLLFVESRLFPRDLDSIYGQSLCPIDSAYTEDSPLAKHRFVFVSDTTINRR